MSDLLGSATMDQNQQSAFLSGTQNIPNPNASQSSSNNSGANGANRQRRILVMGPSDCGKTSMARVIFENVEPARTHHQSVKSQVPVRDDIFLFGRKLFSFVDCGGQVHYFDGYLLDPFLFLDIAALVFVADASVLSMASQEDQQQQQQPQSRQQMLKTWNPESTRDVFARVVRVLLEKSPDAKVFVVFNKMDKVDVPGVEKEQTERLLEENGRKMQQIALDAILHAAAGSSSNGDTNNSGVSGSGWTNERLQQIIANAEAANAAAAAQQTAATRSMMEVNEGEDVGAIAGATAMAIAGGSSSFARSASNVLENLSSSAFGAPAHVLNAIVPLFHTSLLNSTIVHAWSQIMRHLLEPSSALCALQEWLDRARQSAGDEILELCLLDSSTSICIASSSVFGPITMANEVAIRSKRQRLRGLQHVLVTHPLYSMAWRTCVPNKLALLVVGDGTKTTAGVTQYNADKLVEHFNSRFVSDDGLQPPWPSDVIQVRTLLGTI